jgi:hypothetical protein
VLLDFKCKGLIAQTGGSGTYVSDKVQGAVAAPTTKVEQRDARRQTCRPDGCAPRSRAGGDRDGGRHRDHARLRPKDESNACAEAAVTFEDFENWDGQFHAAVAAAARNGVIAGVSRLINEVRAPASGA